MSIVKLLKKKDQLPHSSMVWQIYNQGSSFESKSYLNNDKAQKQLAAKIPILTC